MAAALLINTSSAIDRSLTRDAFENPASFLVEACVRAHGAVFERAARDAVGLVNQGAVADHLHGHHRRCASQINEIDIRSQRTGQSLLKAEPDIRGQWRPREQRDVDVAVYSGGAVRRGPETIDRDHAADGGHHLGDDPTILGFEIWWHPAILADEPDRH